MQWCSNPMTECSLASYNGNAAAPDNLLRLTASGSLQSLHPALPGATFAWLSGSRTGSTRTVSGRRLYGHRYRPRHGLRLCIQHSGYDRPAAAGCCAERPRPAGKALPQSFPTECTYRTAGQPRPTGHSSDPGRCPGPGRTRGEPDQGSTAHQLNLRDLATGIYALHLRTSASLVVKKLAIE